MKLYTPQPIGPIRCVDGAGNPVLDPTVTIAINDANFVAASGSISVIGGGWIVYNPTPADCGQLGFVIIKVSGTAQESALREDIEANPQGIPAGTTDATWLHVGPLRALDSATGAPVLGEDFSGAGELEVSLTGAPWIAATGTIVEMSGGYYDYVPGPGEYAAPGWLAVKAAGVCQEFIFRVDIVRGANSPTAGVLSGSSDSAALDRISGDLALVWSNELGSADLSLELDVGGLAMDLTTDRGLTTAVLLSLFLDRRAETDDKPPSGDSTDRRGWWGDQFAEVEGDKIGSRLWLLDRSKRTNETALRAEEYVREALAWMIEDRVVSSIDVTIEMTQSALLIAVGLQRPGRDPVPFRFASAWDHSQEAA
jgi:phage gp46-like protein